MKTFDGSEGKYSKQGDKNESKLFKVLQDDAQNDPDGVLYVILETMQEIDTYVQVNNMSLPDSDDDGGFHASSELPASCAVDEEEHMFTTTEVSNALQRNATPPTREDEIQVDKGDPRRRGLRFRKSKNRKRDQENADSKPVEGIFGSSVQPPSWSLSNYLQSVASTREKRIVAVTAWLLALVGLIVALVFVTKDFVDSRKDLASTVRYEDSPSLDIPPLWLCTADSEIPPFMNLPNEQYRGKPLVWLDFVRGTHAKINITYPKTKDMKQLSVGSFDGMGKPCNATDAMDPLLYFRENTAKPSCFYCLTLARAPALTIQKDGETAEGISFSRLATMRVAQHSFTSQCRTSQFGLSRILLRFFREELKAHHSALSERGILDFGERDAGNSSQDPLLWPDYRLGFQNSTVDFVVYDIVDMFCNVYLFSGFFYPSTSKGIKYKFNNRVYRWERSGTGPYYPENYFEYYTKSDNVVLYTGNAAIGEEKYENRSIYDARTLQVRTNYSRIGGAETLAVLSPNQIANIELSKHLIYQKESYTAKVLRTAVLPGDVRAINNIYFLDIGFKTFLTRIVSDQQSVSWSAFSADFFGLTSLFMDVSVYTLIVAPLIMRGKRRALMARKQRMDAGNAV